MDIGLIDAYVDNSSKLFIRSIAPRYATALPQSYLINGMKTVEETRLERLRDLVSEAGSIANLNRAAERNERDATVSQILNRWTGKSGKPKELGSEMARELEHAMNKPRGWMDNDPELTPVPWPFKNITPEQFARLSELDRGRLEERALILIEASTVKSSEGHKAA